MSESFVFYKSFADAIRELPAEQYKAVMVALSDYALAGVIPEEMDPVLRGFFLLMKPQIDANNARRENGRNGAKYGKLGGRPKTETPSEPQENPTETPNVNVNDNVNVKEKDTNVSQKKSSAFRKPTVDEVRAYCLERRNNVDPQRFVDFYEAKGWKVGSQSMKDWKACVRTWEQRNRGDPPKAAGITRGTDYDALIRRRL